MSDHSSIRKKANTYFFSKVAFNLILMIAGAFLISLFLRQIQNQTALVKQRDNSEQALNEAIEILKENEDDAGDLTVIFHDGNQDMLEDLRQLLTGGLFDFLTEMDTETRSEVFADIVERSGVDYLFIMSEDGRMVLTPLAEFYGIDPVQAGLLSTENAAKLLVGTLNRDGSVSPVFEENSSGSYYFYSIPCEVEGGMRFVLVLGAESSVLDVQIASLNDLSVVLSRSAVGNNGFMFAVDRDDQNFIYYRQGNVDLSGTSALASGLSEAALQDGYSGLETINGVKYYCVSRTFGDKTVICAVADTVSIFANDRYVLFWSITGFVLVMLLCLAYAVIVRNDFVRHMVNTDKVIIRRKEDNNLYFDRSVFRKVFPLMISGVLLIYGISFYTQTLLEISEGIEDSVIALEEVTGRYQESIVNRELIENYYNERFLAKARMIAYLNEEDPSVLNENTEHYYSYYDEQGYKQFLSDDEGSRLKSVASSARLQQLCDGNDIKSIYIFDEDGRTIATNTPNWFFEISHDPEYQSYEFLEVLDGKKDSLIQSVMLDEMGEDSQYIGVAFNYYTSRDENGNMIYCSHHDYETSVSDTGTEEDEEADYRPVTKHRGLLQIGLNRSLSRRLLASTEASSVLSSDMLSGGFIVLFDASADPVCLYSPNPASIGRTASEMNVSPNAFSGTDYYGFTRVNGVNYFQYFRYLDGYNIGTAIPKENMYRARMTIALITSLTSLILILFLSLTVTMTTDEEEHLYETMSEEEEENGLDSAIFGIILPSGRHASTVKAAARWDNRRIPWDERSPEQKLLFLISIAGMILLAYVLISVIGADRFYSEDSVINYILKGEWDRSPNVFALSACFVVLIMASVAVTALKIPVRLSSALLGARGETVSHLLLSVVRYGGTLGALFYCLYLVGMDAGNLLASAGVLSLVIGFGAQSLVKDIIAGIFIVFEGEFRVGDIVTIGGYRGTVMDIGLRTTKIQSADGNIKIFNNSDISGVLNMTKETSLASARISIEYGQDIDYVEAVLFRELPTLRDVNPKILDGPDYGGVDKLGESGIELVVFARCFEKDVRSVSRFLNKELLRIFYRNNINVPFPNVTISDLDMSGRRTIWDFNRDLEEAAKHNSVMDPDNSGSDAEEKTK